MELPKYLPFADGKWQLTMGVKPLDLATWIEIDGDLGRELLLKEELLRDRYSAMFLALPGSEPSQQEMLEIVIAHLQQYFPQHYHWSAESVTCLATSQGWKFADFYHAPLDLVGRIIQEDMVLMESSPAGYIMTAAAECFRLRWHIQEKIGKPLAQIHSPVPDYEQKLAHPMDNLFARIPVAYPLWRMNWGIVNDDNLLLEEDEYKIELDNPITIANAGDRLWLRVERQCLRRLPRTGAIAFSTHTYIHSLSVVVQIPNKAAALLSALKQMPPEMQHYKGILPIQEALFGYLELVYDQKNS